MCPFLRRAHIFSTFSVAPEDIVPEEGRDKLSLAGFELGEPHFIESGSVIYDGDEFAIYPLDEGEFGSSYLMDDGESPLQEWNHSFTAFRVQCDKDQIVISVDSKEKPKIKVIDPRRRNVIIK